MPAAPLLDPDVVDLWTVDLNGDAAALARAEAVLEETERARAQRIVRPHGRERFTIARAALRTILGGYLRVPAAQVGLEREPSGKPSLTEPAGLAFSLSHSHALAAIAVAARPQVGIDIEQLVRRPVPEAVWRRVLDARELACVLSVSPRQRDEAFLRHWTAKEAYVKAVGVGLAGLRGVSIIEALGTPSIASGAWSVQRFDPRPGVIGAVVVAGGPWLARQRCLSSGEPASQQGVEHE
jgi:4'-phosphopantetheinyl transferase